ncbi:MAG: hypothetical protein WCO44_12575 [Bacteroidota bacterium]
MEKRPFAFYLLVFLLAIQALGALFGGLSLVLSPSGELLHIPLTVLKGSPFATFLIPGLILLIVLGILPGILVFALFRRPVWEAASMLNIYRGIHWSWTCSLYLGIMLIIWILLEVSWIGYDILQTIFGLVGVAIVVATLLPANMRYFGWTKTHKL